jgi:hypothetical protein
MAFNLGRLTDSENRLRRDFSEFSRLWASVREDWLDERCEQYQREHLTTIGPSLNRLTATLHEFYDNVRKADHALKDDQRPSDELN